MRRIAAAFCIILLLTQGAFALEGTEMIEIPEWYAAPEAALGPYAACMQRGESLTDEAALIERLLGTEAIDEGGGRYVEAKDGEAWERKIVHINAETGEISFWDPAVSSERGAEYEPPAIGVSRDEALLLCKWLLREILPEDHYERLSLANEEAQRWNGEERRRMDDVEYDAFCRENKLAYFRFDHVSENGLAILDDGLMASVGANGLNGFSLQWHAFEALDEQAELMPLQAALEMASSTRSAKAVLLYAVPVYSNRVSGDENFNLSWYIATSKGNYVVDCVLGRHVCDSWEY